MLKALFITVIIVGIGLVGVYYWNDLNIQGIANGPGCNSAPAPLFKTKTVAIPLVFKSVAGGIQYDDSRNWDELVQKASQQKKRIMMCYVTTSCGFCKLMKDKVFKDKSVGEIVNDNFLFVPVQLDETDHDSKYMQGWREDVKRLAKEQGIEGVPAFSICNSNGEMKEKFVGALDAEKFINNIKVVLKN